MKAATLLTGGLLALALTVGANSSDAAKPSVERDEAALGNLVQHSHPYVAMHNVNNKFTDTQGRRHVALADTPANPVAWPGSLKPHHPRAPIPATDTDG